jgi:hypothetical protein
MEIAPESRGISASDFDLRGGVDISGNVPAALVNFLRPL